MSDPAWAHSDAQQQVTQLWPPRPWLHFSSGEMYGWEWFSPVVKCRACVSTVLRCSVHFSSDEMQWWNVWVGVIFASGEMQDVRFSRAEMQCAFQQWRDAGAQMCLFQWRCRESWKLWKTIDISLVIIRFGDPWKKVAKLLQGGRRSQGCPNALSVNKAGIAENATKLSV